VKTLPFATLLLLLAGCTTGAPAPPTPTSTPAPARTSCGSPVDRGPLPEWARTGFTGDTSTPHVLGDHGDILAVVFGDPLTANRTDEMANKILWVARADPDPGDLTIAATLDGTTTPQTRSVPGGPGPSIVDLPRAGCWRLTLTWPGHTDTLDLIYRS
jgi:hypothetical protein